jgi:acetylornithine deacetylase/succinyl-diaminopimelate desuccinylase-like protein
VSEWLQRALREALPEGAELELTQDRGQPALFDVDLPAMRLAAEAIDRSTGMSTAFIRSGGSIPIVAELAAKGVPAIVSGFALADDDIHAPNESYRLESLRMGEKAARELYAALARL